MGLRELRSAGALLWVLLGGCSSESGPEVIDCRTGACVRQAVDRAEVCGRDPAPAICAEPEAVFDAVALVADAENYVAGPVTEARFDVEILDVQLEMPWDLEFLPDGSMLITERGGKFQQLVDGSLVEVKSDLTFLLSVETGLLGLAVDPAFAENRFVYVYYTYALGERLQKARQSDRHGMSLRVRNRVSRLRFVDGALRDEKILLNRLPGSVIHSGGRLRFGPDGKLYVTTGDAGLERRSGDVGFRGGKILRIEPDGRIPSDNPFPNSAVYSRGHRNPQGLAWHPESGALYASEHGENRAHDELNRVERGADHGWPWYECDRPFVTDAAPPPDLVFPAACFATFTMAPSGMRFVADRSSPWFGSLFLTGLRGRHLRRFEFAGDAVVREEIFWVSDGAAPSADGRGGMDLRLRDVEYRDGALWVIGDGWGLAKLTPAREGS